MVSEAQNPGTSRRGGLFDSLKVLTATLIAIAHTRLELLSTELEEQWCGLAPCWYGHWLAYFAPALASCWQRCSLCSRCGTPIDCWPWAFRRSYFSLGRRWLGW